MALEEISISYQNPIIWSMVPIDALIQDPRPVSLAYMDHKLHEKSYFTKGNHGFPNDSPLYYLDYPPKRFPLNWP